MSWIKSKANIILSITSCVFALFIFEIGCKYILKKDPVYQFANRYMLFSDGKDGVFKNVDKFFIYESNREVHYATYYYIDKKWVKEYEYFGLTNNCGLLQTDSTKQNIPSVLLLGDSFTEGQGASPWFENFRSGLSKTGLQYVNGGIFGTGFQQWEMLHDYLVKANVVVRHVVVIFISDDYRRGVWNMPPHTLECIKEYKSCIGNEDFYGMPPSDERTQFLDKLRAYREGEKRKYELLPKELFKRYLPATTMILKYLGDFIGGLQGNPNRSAIADLISRYRQNVLFVHIPDKQEVRTKKLTKYGITAIRDIEKFGGNIFDGYANCGFTQADYFVNDGHPNEKGYSKISACVTAAVKERWGFQ